MVEELGETRGFFDTRRLIKGSSSSSSEDSIAGMGRARLVAVVMMGGDENEVGGRRGCRSATCGGRGGGEGGAGKRG